MNCSDDLHHFDFHWLLRALDVLDSCVAFLGQICQIILEANGTVIGDAIRVQLNAVLFGNLACVVLTLSEGITEITDREALLIGQRTRSSIAQSIGEINIPGFDLPTVYFAVRQCH